MIREERGNRVTMDSGRNKTSSENVINGTTTGMCGSPGVPPSEAVATDVIEQRQATTVGSRGNVPKIWMPSIKVSHVDHSTISRYGQGWEINDSRSRIDVTQTDRAVPHNDLKELKGHVILSRVAEKLVGQGGVYICNKTVPDIMCVRGIAGKRRHRFPWYNTTRKSFLYKNYLWAVARNVCLQRSEFRVVSDSESIPRYHM